MFWEAHFLLWLQSIRTDTFDAAMKYISLLGEKGILCICVGLALLIIPKTRRTGIQVLAAIALAYIIGNLVIKNIVQRPRPYEEYAYLMPLIEKPRDTSFPSGHTVIAFAAASAIFLNYKTAGAFALLFAVTVAFSRLYNCVHYPTDVLAGIAIGVVCAVLVHYLVYPACENGVDRLKAKKKT